MPKQRLEPSLATAYYMPDSLRRPVLCAELRDSRELGVARDQGEVLRKRDRRDQQIARFDRLVAQEVANPCVVLSGASIESDYLKRRQHRSGAGVARRGFAPNL